MAGDTPLTRDAILGASDLPTETVAVPEWGGLVTVRGLTAAERDELEATQLQLKGGKVEYRPASFRAQLVARCILGPDGARLFTDGDVDALNKKSAVAMERVFGAALRLSGFTATDLKDLEKN